MENIFNKKLTNIQLWERILGFSKEIKTTVCLYLFFISLNKFFALGISYVIAESLSQKSPTPIKLAIFFFLFKFFEWLFFVVQERFLMKTRGVVIGTISHKIFEKILNLPQNIQKGLTMVDLLKKVDIRSGLRNFIGFSINHFMMLFLEVIVATGIIFHLCGLVILDVAVLLIVTIGLLIFVGNYISEETLKLSEDNPVLKMQKAENDLITTTNELFSKIWLAKMYHAEELFIKLRKEGSEKERILLENYRYKFIKFHALVFCICSLSLSLIFFLCFDKLNAHVIDKPTFSALMVILSGLFWKLQQITYIFEEIGKFKEILSPAFNILEIDFKLIEKKILNLDKNKLEIKGLTFSYGSKTILNDISLSLEHNETLFLVGKSGAGKSTLLNLILSEEKTEIGQILWNNEDINKLKDIVAWIPQDTIIKGGNIDFNISIGKQDASYDEKIDALKKAQIYKKVFEVGGITQDPENKKLSGGEMQRLAIARAFLSQRPLFLLDEPTSALDVELEKLFFNEIMQLEDKIKIIVIHRILAIPENSKIAVLDKGEIVEYGRLTELLNKEGLFKKMYEEAKNESN